MSTTLLIVLCCAPLIGIFMFLGATQKRREAQAMRDFAALLENGSATPGQAGKGPRAMGRWKGREVTVRFFARLHPPVFLTAVAMSRRPSPLVALLVPRGDRPVAHREATADAPQWIVALDHAYDAGWAPTESFRVVMDESTATLLMKLES